MRSYTPGHVGHDIVKCRDNRFGIIQVKFGITEKLIELLEWHFLSLCLLHNCCCAQLHSNGRNFGDDRHLRKKLQQNMVLSVSCLTGFYSTACSPSPAHPTHHKSRTSLGTVYQIPYLLPCTVLRRRRGTYGIINDGGRGTATSRFE